MNTKKYQELLTKYLSGACTPEEILIVESWYKSLSENEISSALGIHSDEEKQILLEKNWTSLQSKITTEPTKQNWYRSIKYWAAAASIIFIISICSVWYAADNDANNPYAIQENIEIPSSQIEKHNTSTSPLVIKLSDNSIVTLQPKSIIRYTEVFEGEKREVTLEGEAFFEIAKNPEKPFIVYSNNLITKVLGTSFNIKSNKTTGNVQVDVRSGRVSVFSKVNKNKKQDNIILTPNQRAEYISDEDQLVMSIVEKPVILISNEEFQKFTFKDAPIEKVFDAIEKAYGIQVMYDKTVMKDCRITTSLDDENLFDKISIICKLLGASYEIIDTKVVIEGVNCL
jgi:transmembrane sensor